MKYFFLTLGLIFASVVHAQVDCSLTVDQPAAPLKAGDKLSARLTVEIDSGWHIYSLTQADGGPVKSEIALAKGQAFKLAGKIDAPDPDRAFSDAFNLEVQSYQNEVVFTLPLIATGPISPGTKLKVNFTSQACTEENCQLPKTQTVEATLGTKKDAK